MHDARDFLPLYERVSDYIFNMKALTRRQARQLWRDSIKDAWNNCCAYCGKPPIADESLTELTLDHVKPKSRGGQDKTCNVIPACASCNQQKSSQDWMPWYRLQPFYTIEGEWRIKQWLASGRADFGHYDEKDSHKIEQYLINHFNQEWPIASM